MSREDVALLRRLRAGESAAFTELVRSYHGSLLRVARSFVADRPTAEEVVQDTWVVVIDGIHGFEGRSSLKTWIFHILSNRARTRGVRERRSISFSAAARDGDEAAVEPERFLPNGMWAKPPTFASPEDAAKRAEFLRHLEIELAALPAQQRVVVTLRDVEGLSAEEACNVLGVSESNQRVLLHRGRSKLRKVLEPFLGG
jgi:RNA polymerase sigma-70 factor (ECF subfamily)